jgi:hypothetical protein
MDFFSGEIDRQAERARQHDLRQEDGLRGARGSGLRQLRRQVKQKRHLFIILIIKKTSTLCLCIIIYNFNYNYLFFKYHPIPWRDSISLPVAPVSSMAGGDDTTT